LLDHFGPRSWWPADHPWEMMVGAILTQNTAWTNVEKALANLKKARSLNLKKVAQMPRRSLERLIRPAGFFRQKAERLREFARLLVAEPVFYRQLLGKVPADLPPLRTKLLAVKGIGPETADSILLYAGSYATFVVDAYTRRIGQRYGLFKFADYDQVQDFFHQRLPIKAPLYNEFHALLVELAKRYCRSQNPACAICPLVGSCAHGSIQAGSSRSGKD